MYDQRAGTLSINKARVVGRDKAYPKTGVDRVIELCPRAQEAMKRLLALRAKLKLAGKVNHDKLFIKEDGAPYHDLQVQGQDCTLRSPFGRIVIRHGQLPLG
jgi:hypothetical protein